MSVFESTRTLESRKNETDLTAYIRNVIHDMFKIMRRKVAL